MPDDGNKGHADGSRNPKPEICTRCGFPVHNIYYRTQWCACDTKDDSIIWTPGKP